MSRKELFQNMAKSVIDGEIGTATDLMNEALADGINPGECINKGFRSGLDEIGKGFETGFYFLPDLVLAGKVMQAVVDLLADGSENDFEAPESLGTVMLATVTGDLHSIGKQLVGMMLSVNGFKVIDLGVDVPTASIVSNVKEINPDVLGLSSLLSTTTAAQRDVIETLKEEGIRDNVKVMVGGAVVSREWSNEIGADGYAEDANAAVHVVKEVMGI